MDSDRNGDGDRNKRSLIARVLLVVQLMGGGIALLYTLVECASRIYEIHQKEPTLIPGCWATAKKSVVHALTAPTWNTFSRGFATVTQLGAVLYWMVKCVTQLPQSNRREAMRSLLGVDALYYVSLCAGPAGIPVGQNLALEIDNAAIGLVAWLLGRTSEPARNRSAMRLYLPVSLFVLVVAILGYAAKFVAPAQLPSYTAATSTMLTAVAGGRLVLAALRTQATQHTRIWLALYFVGLVTRVLFLSYPILWSTPLAVVYYGLMLGKFAAWELACGSTPLGPDPWVTLAKRISDFFHSIMVSRKYRAG